MAFEPANQSTPQPLEHALDNAVRLGNTSFVHGDRISTVAWAADGAMLATGAGRRYGITPADELLSRGKLRNSDALPASPMNTIRLWALPEGTLIAELVGHRLGIAEMRFSPDGKSLSSIDDEGDLIVWDIPGSMEIKPIIEATLDRMRVVRE